MNILQLAKYYPPVFGGIELVEKMITRAHAQKNDQMFIVAFSDIEKKEIGEFKETIYRIYESFKFLSAPFNLNFIFQFKKIILENDIKRIYIHLPNPFMHEVVRLYSHFLKEHGVQVIAIYHSDIVNKKILGDIYQCYFNLSSSIYDFFIASSDKLWRSSPVLRKISDAKKIIIPFCVEEDFRPVIKKTLKNKIISIGRMVPYKGYEFLIAALNDSKYELHLIGDGPLLEKLVAMSSKNIIFYKNINDAKKNEIFDECDVLVVSSISRAEAYGMTIVESFGRGIPVVASDIDSGVTYLVQNGITGFTFKINSKNELLEALDKIYDESNYNRIANNCRHFYDENLSFDKFKERLLII